MKKLLLLLFALVLSLAVTELPRGSTGAKQDAPFPEVPRITKGETKAMLGDPSVAIIDVRPVEQWKYSDQMIPHAVHEDPLDVASWAHKYGKDQTIIIY